MKETDFRSWLDQKVALVISSNLQRAHRPSLDPAIRILLSSDNAVVRTTRGVGEEGDDEEEDERKERDVME